MIDGVQQFVVIRSQAIAQIGRRGRRGCRRRGK